MLHLHLLLLHLHGHLLVLHLLSHCRVLHLLLRVVCTGHSEVSVSGACGSHLLVDNGRGVHVLVVDGHVLVVSIGLVGRNWLANLRLVVILDHKHLSVFAAAVITLHSGLLSHGGHSSSTGGAHHHRENAAKEKPAEEPPDPGVVIVAVGAADIAAAAS